MQQNNSIKSIRIEGFKSIKNLDIELKPLNILVGPNGAGKSNFIQIFEFLKKVVDGNLQYYVQKSGGADRFLYFGSKRTQNITIKMEFTDNTHTVDIVWANPDTFIVKRPGPVEDIKQQVYQQEWENMDDEKIDKETEVKQKTDGSEERKPIKKGLVEDIRAKVDTEIASKIDDKVLFQIRHAFGLYSESFKIYHFHDTSNTAPVKSTAKEHDNISLHPDASNLASMLYRFKISDQYNHYYKKIVHCITMVAPFFENFILEPENRYILPRWKHRGSDKAFDFYDLSDGTLRFICLATLLKQPPELLPQTILIDEPELGLHPHAIQILASAMKAVANQGKQLIVSSQSVTLMNEFCAEDILVVDRCDEQTMIRRLTEEEIKNWIDDYRLGDIWAKNIIGGIPDDY